MFSGGSPQQHDSVCGTQPTLPPPPQLFSVFIFATTTTTAPEVVRLEVEVDDGDGLVDKRRAAARGRVVTDVFVKVRRELLVDVVEHKWHQHSVQLVSQRVFDCLPQLQWFQQALKTAGRAMW